MSTDTTKSEARAQVLIVEDEESHADVMSDALRKPGHVCTIVNGVEAAIEELKGGVFDVVVTDLRMPTSAGAEFEGEKVVPDGANAGLIVLRAAAKLQPTIETIMVTAHGDVPTARSAFKEGAYDFIEKPLDLEVFRNLVGRAAQTVLLRHQNSELKDELELAGFEGLIAVSEPMRKVLQMVRTVAASDIPVLITGESGTGKELIARAVHRNSKRSAGRYVTFNCAGQSESLLEDQLFGHVKGAYTGAEKEREGVFEYASGGTLFLDEIGDMPVAMQPKLLRVLESGEVIRLGANEAKHVDVRFVSATNRDLNELVKTGDFREDLFFRVNAAKIHLPPLRERREDIPPLVVHGVKKFADDLLQGEPEPTVSDAAMLRLTSYAWPGNVRQLLNAVQNMVVTGIGSREEGQPIVLGVDHLPPEIREAETADLDDSGTGGSLAGTSLDQLEKRAIRETLRLTAGNREQAAKLLGIGERTLYRKLKEYGLR
ncbi:MAG: sigma-54-dependent Fis family transcriptional regulator [Phycisphaera sp.]|nr:MAG: sigma-54-dependent Fis family transcriptional regulator [Phycisphaera sp.]